jgi:SAM-dependent methyltransferase
MDPAVDALLEAAAGYYAGAGPFQSRFARGKLRTDPIYAALLRQGCLPGRGVLADLGCGRGLLLALIVAARDRFRNGAWPARWPPPPSRLLLEGYEIDAPHAAVARDALEGHARVTLQDVREAVLPSCSAVALLDVLLYLDRDDQEQVLQRAATALEPGGVLLLREADAARRLSFHVTRWSEQALEVLRARRFSQLHYRSAVEWASLIQALGLSVRMEPMSDGTPFANVLFVCTKTG